MGKGGSRVIEPNSNPEEKIKIRFCTRKTRTAKSKRQEVKKISTKKCLQKNANIAQKTSTFIISMLFEITRFHLFSTEKGGGRPLYKSARAIFGW
jgi:hypothetical protein